MEKSKGRTQKEESRDASFSNQLGFTYIELVLSMFLTLVMVPAIFFCFFQFVSEGKKIMENERNQMNWLSCYMWMHKEIKRAQNFRTDKETLLFELPTGETVRYRWDQGRIVRQIQKRPHQSFQGYTVLLQQVKAFRFIPDQSGVLISFTFHNDYVVRTYIQGRIENK